MGYIDEIIGRYKSVRSIRACDTISSVAIEIHLLHLGEESRADFSKVQGSKRYDFFTRHLE